MTRVGTPAFSSASCIASAFITVASMPIWSAVVRSIPWAAPLRPRKMLPPPMTSATSQPSARTSATSAAICLSVGTSSP